MTTTDTLQVLTVTAREQVALLDEPMSDAPLGDGEVAGRALYSLISPGTEINSAYLGDAFPKTVGYAGVFRVEQVGGSVEDLQVGDMCFCSGPQGVGGHQSHYRMPREAAIKLPDGLKPQVAVHARLMGVSMATLTTTRARPPERVLITGLGPVGHLAAQLFAACGYKVTAVDPIEARRTALAGRSGITTLEQAPTEKPKLFALAIDCSGHEAAVLDCIRAVRGGGEVSVLGVPWQQRTSDVSGHDILKAVYRGFVTLRSGWEWQVPRHGAPFRHGDIWENFAAAMDWLNDGRVNVDGLYEIVKPSDAQQVYQDLLHRKRTELFTLFDWTG